MRMRIAALLVAAAALGGCAYNGLGLGVGYGSGYGPYGYYDPYYGSGYGYYGSRYGYSPYGMGYYGSPYWGWYDGWYYPGTGYYVYDRERQRRLWTEAERRYWGERLQQSQSSRGVTKMPNSELHREIWNDFQRGSTTTSATTSSTERRSLGTERVRQQRVERAERAERRSSSSDRGVTRRKRDD
jgi:hypothetical protein